ncbi:thermonuclease family protein [Sulfurimonas sp. HSL-3221]|uniref:thermonuclease family protein n=1 Tax=Sulfurimonadaceae TaxID=2771471 RepID=UPI001E5D7ECC|nr:thermonuclease family protein [Sulfurimonas sp. HSL-3221]UFS62738.1 thermonuclease family protein [Sulfurimonas sp. HSL-3221]
MIKTLAILLLLTALLSAISIHEKDFGNVRIAEVTSIYDGDTFRVNILGYPGIIGERIPIRLNGIDTPEIRGKCDKEKILARKAKQYTVHALRAANTIELRHMKRGKYFRIVADVYVDGRSLARGLITSGFAVPYDGGRKTKDWCE